MTCWYLIIIWNNIYLIKIMLWLTNFEIKIILVLIIWVFSLNFWLIKKAKNQEEKLIRDNYLIDIYTVSFIILFLVIELIIFSFLGISSNFSETFFLYTLSILLSISFFIWFLHWFINRKEIKDNFVKIYNYFRLFLSIMCLFYVYLLWIWYFK